MAELDKQQQDTQEYYGNYPNFRVASGIKIPDGDLKGLPGDVIRVIASGMLHEAFMYF